ncbi:S41 family peptidase [Lentisalinibacter orientalis]|uniref:S41 family peptidase n=1 Tax=Lentisalinibacter orientalis TaxID=2992241 RepID=UPI0038706F6D
MNRFKSVGIMIFAALATAACGGGGGGGGTASPPTGTADCSATAQKEFVLARMRDIYFWLDDLPQTVDIDQYATPEELLDFLVAGQPLDRFSYIDTASADSAFFGEGQYEGFGFSTRFIDTDGDSQSDEVRFVRVFSDSPAADAGLARGQYLRTVDGRSIAEIQAAGELADIFTPDTIQFGIERLDGTTFDVVVSKGVVTIDPVPQWRVIDTPGGPVGYLEFAQFISTAEGATGPLAEAFTEFAGRDVADLVLDLRYNGGGLVRTAELLGDYLGGFIAEGDVFSETLFNAQNAARNDIERFERLASSLNLSRLIVIASRSTASASELVINGLFPEAEVVIVGDRTFGKPVGQTAEVLDDCDFILRPVAFQTVNGLGEGDYFGGLPVDCPAPDDLDFPVGGDDDPSLTTSLAYLENGACPAPATLQKTADPARQVLPEDRSPPWRNLNGVH